MISINIHTIQGWTSRAGLCKGIVGASNKNHMLNKKFKSLNITNVT